jgi:hypothetical protein
MYLSVCDASIIYFCQTIPEHCTAHDGPWIALHTTDDRHSTMYVNRAVFVFKVLVHLFQKSVWSWRSTLQVKYQKTLKGRKIDFAPH